MAESKGLGRGLDALLGAMPTASASRGGGTLPLSLLQPGAFQPRREIRQQPLAELAASIKANGRQQELAKLSGVAQGDISRLEIGSGEKGPTFDTLVRLAHAQDMKLVVELVPNGAAADAGSSSVDEEEADGHAQVASRVLINWARTADWIELAGEYSPSRRAVRASCTRPATASQAREPASPSGVSRKERSTPLPHPAAREALMVPNAIRETQSLVERASGKT
jgi:transcriptional regulator with XRE-family HTH domain